MRLRAVIWLACQLAGWVYGIEPGTLERIAWRESRYTVTAQRGTCCGLMQTESRFSRYTCEQLKNPLVSSLEAARLLRWARHHCRNNGEHWYRTGKCQ